MAFYMYTRISVCGGMLKEDAIWKGRIVGNSDMYHSVVDNMKDGFDDKVTDNFSCVLQ